MIHLKVKFTLFPAEYAGMVTVLRRAGHQPPARRDYPTQASFMADLTVYSVLLDYHHKLGCSVTPERWQEKEPGRAHTLTLPTPVVIALWRFLSGAGCRNDAERALFGRLDKLLVDGQLLRSMHAEPLYIAQP